MNININNNINLMLSSTETGTDKDSGSRRIKKFNSRETDSIVKNRFYYNLSLTFYVNLPDTELNLNQYV